MLKLVIQDDEGKTTVVPLIRDEITVGRKEGNTIRLTERNVSRKHARIVKANGSIAVEDLNSYNGVRVNGSRIQGRVGINVSDRIQIGDYLIELKAEGAAVPADAFGDETQPVETMAAQAAAATQAATTRVSAPVGMPIPVLAGDDDATTKMATPVTAMLPAAGVTTAPDVAPTPPIQQDMTPPAKLVILSTGLAGQEYDLTQLAMVIGRTEDNDVVVNHRSISRHHAKVVNENGRYAIVDMQSSNGVRVNGEEYSKVELRRGDVIDLGHVRMRFVEPGEDFVFGRDAHAVPMPGSGRGRGLMIAAIALVALGALAIFLLTRGDEEGDKTAGQSAVGEKGPTNDGPKNINPTPPSTSEALEKIKPLLELARGSIEQEEWSSAYKSAQKALEIAPDSREAQELAKKAKFEQESKERFQEFRDAVKDKNYSGVAESFRGIDQNSIYKDQAREIHNDVRDKYVGQTAARAKILAKKRRCSDLDDLREKAAGTWEEASDALAGIDCSEAVAKNGQDDKKKKKKKRRNEQQGNGSSGSNSGNGGNSGNSGNGGNGSSRPTKPYKQLMDEARAAMMKNQYGKARARCDEALKLKPRDGGAATLCGIAACNMRKARLAKKYQAMVPNARKAMIRQQCLKAGLSDFQ